MGTDPKSKLYKTQTILKRFHQTMDEWFCVRSDNYEVTVGMAMALISRGWRYGHNLFHLAFPKAEHNEAAWARRVGPFLQFLFPAG